uniref:Uncharacterized protein n=1 Tax=Caenorhabditis japonica TaxID=281687 RepID=A0A8R1E137_CAEJA
MVTDLLKNCVNRKSHLEKILFAYHNLHQLDPCYSELAHKAFISKDPLALWNYENETILNSREVDDMMNMQSTSYANYSQSAQQFHVQPPAPAPSPSSGYCSGSLVDSLDSPSYQRAPPSAMPPSRGMAQNYPNMAHPTYSQPKMAPQQSIPAHLPHPQYINHNQPQIAQHFATPPNFEYLISQQNVQQSHYTTPPSTSQPILPNFSVPPPPNGVVIAQNQSSTPVMTESMTPQLSTPSVVSFGPESEDNYQDLVFDVNGCAYKRVIITSTCLMPLHANQSSSSSSYSFSSRQSDMTYSDRSESLPRYFDEGPSEGNEDNYELDEEDNDETYRADDYNVDDSTPKMKKTTSNEKSQEVTPTGKIENNVVSVDTESMRVGFSSSIETPDPEPDILKSKRPSTPISEVLKYVCSGSVVEDQWKEVTRKNKSYPPLKPTKNAFVLEKPLPSPPSNDSSAVLDEDKENEEPKRNRKKKMSKKEKRILAAEKAKRLETDDFLLEEAYRARKEYDARAESTDSGVSSLVNKEKKKFRPKAKMIVESVSVSTLPLPQMNPHILHAVKSAILKRAESLRKNGRATTSENPIRQEYLQKVTEYERNKKFDKKETFNVKTFIKSRIQAFREIPRPQSFSRITIYEQIYAGLPRVFMPELCFLKSLASDPNETQFDTYEEVFFNMF